MENVAKSTIRFFDPIGDDVQIQFKSLMEQEADGSFLLAPTNYEIKPIETEYVTTFFTKQDILDLLVGVPDDVPGGTIQIIGYEGYVQPETSPFVHHFELKADNCENDDKEDKNCKRHRHYMEQAL